jgi:hypothetical protein
MSQPEPRVGDPSDGTAEEAACFDSSDLDTPTDGVAPRKVPARGIRKRLLGSGEGDYCIYAIADGTGDIPLGALVPINGVPRFASTVEAKRWLSTESGDIMANKQIMIFKAIAIIDIIVRSVSKIQMQSKVKISVEPNAQERL